MEEKQPVFSAKKQVLYYSRLVKYGVNNEISVTLAEVAEMMFTSTRHCRTLLKQMHELGWIEWSPKVGRNQRSTLLLKYSLTALKADLAQKMIAEGDYEKAMALIDNDKALFGQLLINTSGTQLREGQVHIQLTYDRNFSALLPHIPQRNSERFLLRQVYSCLTKCDKHGLISADLAHHWVYNEEALSWKFHLRPQLSFHNGNEINAEHIASLFKGLKELSPFKKDLAHVVSITAASPLCIEFKLNKPDPGLAGLVADVRYSIQPITQLSSVTEVIGSGVFQVKEHSDKRLMLSANNHFHGYRALTDTVTIWQVPSQYNFKLGETNLDTELANEKLSSTCVNYVTLDNHQPSSQSDVYNQIEDGCLLGIFNYRANLSLLQRKLISYLLTTEDALKSELRAHSKYEIEAVTAQNILPSWVKVLPGTEVETCLPPTLTIALFKHKALEECANAISAIMQRAGIQCEINCYSFSDFYRHAFANDLTEDLILTSLNFDDNLPSSILCWMLSDPILHQSLPESDRLWLEQKLIALRSKHTSDNYLVELEPISTTLISSHLLLPLFHHKQALHFKDLIKGVTMNAWGWPELQNVWIDQ
ncbi:SgrR family transcriptional regulator [Photobacterium minamisatsumaniensis]|uniref:SgrR family transcriptional regulator n=1 Tax=Photobacterium minamisatsumaniensis TaxID=2910233 RepID=UPI003D0E63CB